MQIINFKIKESSFDSGSPVNVSVKVINTSNIDFDGSLTLDLVTDISRIQQNSSHKPHLGRIKSEELNFKLTPNISGNYQVNYILQNSVTGERLSGTLTKR